MKSLDLVFAFDVCILLVYIIYSIILHVSEYILHLLQGIAKPAKHSQTILLPYFSL